MMWLVWVVLCAVAAGDVSAQGLADFANYSAVGPEWWEALHAISESDLKVALRAADPQCHSDMLLYISKIFKEPWASKMFDSSPKLPVGLLGGNTVMMGQYYECINAAVPAEVGFVAQHCMVDINLRLSETAVLPFFYGVCIPSSCSPEDIQTVLDMLMKLISLVPPLKGVVEASLVQENCRTTEARSMKAGDWVVVGFILALGLVALLSTAYDVFQRFKKGNERPHAALSAFSLYTNGKALLSTEQKAGQMTCLYGIRTITTGWVVLGHAYMFTGSGPTMNMLDWLKIYKDDYHIVLSNFYVTVDTFFMLSGMLLTYAFLQRMGRNGTYDVPMSYIHRYIRLTPSYAMIILLEVTILNYIGDGPMWHKLHQKATKSCEDYWWANLLYVHNYVDPLDLCLTHSWYLSADMQMFWVAPLLLYPMFFWPRFRYALLFVVTMVFCWADFGISYGYDLPPNFLVEQSNDRFILEYYPFHTRISPWLVGVGLGCLLYSIKTKKINFNPTPVWTTVGWLVGLALNMAAFQGMMALNKGPGTYSFLESSFFLAFHRVGWSLGIAWIVLMCVTGRGGFVNAILSFKLFQPMSKLSYSVYLIHFSLQRFRMGSLKTNIVAADLDIVYYFVADFVLANILAMLLFLLIEQPFMLLDQHFLGKAQIFKWPKGTAKKEPAAADRPRGDLEAGKKEEAKD